MGGIYTDNKGYKRFKDSDKLVHRAVAENKIGRKLRDDEVVHHQDGDKSNFRKENLSVMSRSFHSKLHNKMKEGHLWDDDDD